MCKPFLVAELLSAHVALAVVGHEHDDRAVSQAVGLKLLEDQPDLAVEFAGCIEVLGPIPPRDGMVGVIRRYDNLGWVGLLRSAKRSVRFLKVDLCEERLMGFEVGPIIRVERQAVGGEVPVSFARARKTERLGKLADVERKIARSRASNRKSTARRAVADIRRRGATDGCGRRSCLIHAGHEGRTTGGTDWCGGVSTGIAHPHAGRDDRDWDF